MGEGLMQRTILTVLTRGRSFFGPGASFPLIAGCAGTVRGVSSSPEVRSPQYGGYTRTGAASVADNWKGRAPRFLVTGASGQVGAELVPFLRSKVGAANVIASDVRALNGTAGGEGPFVYCDVLDKDNMARIILENNVTCVVHLATLLSAVGELNPQLALRVNTVGIQNVLELGVQHQLKVFAPSTIATFGASTPRDNTPNTTVQQPATMYGITKVHQELLGGYYADKFKLDFRSLRFPGLISFNSLPGGGTTDYAVEIFHSAVQGQDYECCLAEDMALPMMYMPDALQGVWDLINAPAADLQHTTYNVTAMSVTPAQVVDAIRACGFPRFSACYRPDFRDHIARTWPASLDDSAARRDWAWAPRYDLMSLAADMLARLQARYRPAAPLRCAAASAP